MALPKGILASIATSNVSSIGEQPAILSNLALGNLIANVNLAQQNAVSGQQSLNQLQMSVLGKVVEQMAQGPTPRVAPCRVEVALTADEIATLRALVQALKRP